jgi:hypothetical protein
MHASRNGTILIIVAGISALLAGLSLAFLARMRSDVEESQALLQYAQAKIMLAAGCNYVQESSRIGWDNYPSGLSVDGIAIHEEAFGWIDVRNGKVGPLNRAELPLANVSLGGVWPGIGSHVRCPMYVRKIPPYATRLNVGFNLMQTSDSSSPDYCEPLLKYPDPQPVIPNGWSKAGGPSSASDSKYAQFKAGDPTPIARTQGKAWFRVYRDGPATFIITCGAGGTMGFKSWSEITTPADQALFNNDSAWFESQRVAEVRLWYRIEWSAAGTETSYHNLQHEIARAQEHYETWPPNASHAWSSSRRTQTWIKNPVGTIRWIQALKVEPTYW